MIGQEALEVATRGDHDDVVPRASLLQCEVDGNVDDAVTSVPKVVEKVEDLHRDVSVAL